jgi:pyruvate formate lyase activating enzyme
MLISAVQKFTMLDYPGKISCIVFTAGCNFRCGYCHNPEFVLPEQLQKIKKSFIPEDVFLKFLDQRIGKLDGVVITGGEPTMHHDLRSFISRIKEKGFQVKLDTNGNNPMVLEELLASKLIDYVAMDVKTDSANYLDLVGGCADAEHIEESIRMLIHSRIAYEFRSTLIREIHTTEMLTNMAEMIRGASEIYLQSFRPGHTLDAAYEKYHPFFPTEMEKIADIFQKTVKKVFIR